MARLRRRLKGGSFFPFFFRSSGRAASPGGVFRGAVAPAPFGCRALLASLGCALAARPLVVASAPVRLLSLLFPAIRVFGFLFPSFVLLSGAASGRSHVAGWRFFWGSRALRSRGGGYAGRYCHPSAIPDHLPVSLLASLRRAGGCRI